MSHRWTSHVTDMNESCHTYEWVMSHIWMRHATLTNLPVANVSESRGRHEWVCCKHEWVMSHICLRHVALSNFPHVDRIVMSHIYKRIGMVHIRALTLSKALTLSTFAFTHPRPAPKKRPMLEYCYLLPLRVVNWQNTGWVKGPVVVCRSTIMLGTPVCVCVCICVCVCVCIYVCMYVCIYVYVCICIYVSMYICIYICVYICVYV